MAGAIYWAQEDAVRRLLRAAASQPDATVTMIGDEAGPRGRVASARDSYEPRSSGREFQRASRERRCALFGPVASTRPIRR